MATNTGTIKILRSFKRISIAPMVIFEQIQDG